MAVSDSTGDARRTTVDRVADALRHEVLTEVISAGASVTESLVATEHAVARPTARAAIDRLVREGILRRAPHSSARVPRMSASDISDLYFTRSCLEREAFIALAKRHEVPVAAHAALADLLVAVNTSPLGVVTADIAFHRALVDAVQSPRLARLHASLMGEVHLCMAQVQLRGLVTPQSIYDDHLAIAGQIVSGDLEKVTQVVTYHLERARDALLQNLRRKQNETNHAGQD